MTAPGHGTQPSAPCPGCGKSVVSAGMPTLRAQAVIVAGLDLSLTNAGIAVLTDGLPTLLRSVGHGGHNGAQVRP